MRKKTVRVLNSLLIAAACPPARAAEPPGRWRSGLNMPGHCEVRRMEGMHGFGDVLMLTGDFDHGCGSRQHSIALWDGERWTPVGRQTDERLLPAITADGRLWVVNRETRLARGRTGALIYRCEKSELPCEAVTPRGFKLIDARVNDLTVAGSTLWLAGWFSLERPPSGASAAAESGASRPTAERVTVAAIAYDTRDGRWFTADETDSELDCGSVGGVAITGDESTLLYITESGCDRYSAEFRLRRVAASDGQPAGLRNGWPLPEGTAGVADAEWLGGRLLVAMENPSASALGETAVLMLFSPETGNWSRLGAHAYSGEVAALAVLADGVYALVRDFQVDEGKPVTGMIRWDPATDAWSPARVIAAEESGRYSLISRWREGVALYGHLPRPTLERTAALEFHRDGVTAPLDSGAGLFAVADAVGVARDGKLWVAGFGLLPGERGRLQVATFDPTAGDWRVAALKVGVRGGAHKVFAFHGDEVFLGGDFILDDADPARGDSSLAVWRGGRWRPLEDGPFRGRVNGLLATPDRLYVGGQFYGVGDPPVAGGKPRAGGHMEAQNFVAWNYAARRYESGCGDAPQRGADAEVSGLAAGAGGDLYAIGRFSRFCGMPAAGLARRHDGVWRGVSHSFHPKSGELWLHALAYWNGRLCVAGNFDREGETPMNGVACHAAGRWMALGLGIKGVVTSLVAGPDGALYASGQFSEAGGRPARCIARWDGTTWAPLAEGLYQQTGWSCERVEIAAGPGAVAAVGQFSHAGPELSGRVAIWITAPVPAAPAR